MPVLPGASPFLLDAGPQAPATVVLCHGFTGSPASMLPWGEALHAAGYTAIGPRLPGHGTRWQDMAVTRWQDWYGELDRAFDEALGRGRPVFVMGLSMGATLSLRLAQERGDEIAGLVVANPSLFSERFDVNYLLPLISRFKRTAAAIAGDIAKPGVVELAYDRVPLAAMRSLVELWKVTRSRLAEVRVPIRVYRSEVDNVVEPSNTRMLLAGISSTDVKSYVMARSHHVLTLDYDAPVLFEGSAEFVAGILSTLDAAGGAGAPAGVEPSP